MFGEFVLPRFKLANSFEIRLSIPEIRFLSRFSSIPIKFCTPRAVFISHIFILSCFPLVPPDFCIFSLTNFSLPLSASYVLNVSGYSMQMNYSTSVFNIVVNLDTVCIPGKDRARMTHSNNDR